jgi:threonylcarbamoyladenosine tRNA methylthiotransferase MtaB
MSETKKIFVKTLGCKVNTFDSNVLESKLQKQGFTITENVTQADITVINTCSVTKNAEKEARYLLRNYRKKNKSSLQVVTGCYAQINSSALSKLDEVDFIIPNEEKSEFVSHLLKKLENKNSNKMPEDVKVVSNNKQKHFKSSVVLFDKALVERTRAVVKIQDGCNGFCAYCQIPYARGASKSVTPENIIKEIKDILSQGIKEIVLTGIDIGDYGREFNKKNPLGKLIEDICKLEGIKRLRISSIDPSDIDDDLLVSMKNNSEIFCNHFHIPLQAGSDNILKLMGRDYDCEKYKKIIFKIRSMFPDAMISADIIPGFPGETEQDFKDTCSFVEEIELSSLHVFPYSPRPNTRALRMPGHLNPNVIKERSKILRQLSDKLYNSFASKFIGKELEVLWENKIDSKNRIMGKSKNYLQVLCKHTSEISSGSITTVKAIGFVDNKNILSSKI